MHPTAIIQLVAYTFWADMRVLQTGTHITPAQFVQPVAPDPGWHSLRGTLVHALDTAYGWRMALMGVEHAGGISETDFADVASLTTRWHTEQTAWLAYVATLTEADLSAVWWQHEHSQRTRWQTIMHVVNDLTHHRSEVAAMLTGFGHSPGELDFDLFVVDSMNN
ncbi:MAG: hypothetical protein RL076_2154 [Chloroflexota bacterium]|jgi:uncharacterized damage-inducible protein DinB